MSRVSRERRSRMAEFIDAHQEYQETKSEKARRWRHRAMFDGSPEDVKRKAERIQIDAWEEGQHKKDRLRKSTRIPWHKKEKLTDD